MKKIITFDLDGVIFPLVQYICKVYGIDYSKVTDHNINLCEQLTDDEKAAICGNFGKREVYENCGVFKGAEKLGQVSELADVYFNSWCVGGEEEIKKEVIHRLAPGVPDSHIMLGTPFKKKAYVQSEYIIEDNLDNIMTAMDRAEHFFLIDAPHNQGPLPEKVTRVKDLDTCMDMLLEALGAKEGQA